MLWPRAGAILNAAAVLEFPLSWRVAVIRRKFRLDAFFDTDMTQHNVAELSIGVSDHSASDADFLALRAEVRCRGFNGQTTFTMARRDIDLFVDDATALTTNARDSALFLGGWEKADQPMRLELARAGLSGRFVARVRIAASGPRSDQWNRVETDFIAAPAEFNAFLEGLRGLAATSQPAASLVGDADDIA